MSRTQYKVLLIGAWIAVVFGYLWLLSLAYDQEKSFLLFVFLALSSNLAYDGLRELIRYNPLYKSDLKTITLYVAGFIASLIGSISLFLVFLEVWHYGYLAEWIARWCASISFLLCIAAGMVLLARANDRFRLTR